ncbi:MAG: hypothetical protein ACKVHE_30060 [Planctomycetales bacterium]
MSSRKAEVTQLLDKVWSDEAEISQEISTGRTSSWQAIHYRDRQKCLNRLPQLTADGEAAASQFFDERLV